MRNKLINIFRIVFILILVTLGLLVFFRPAHTETNILKAIFSSTQDNLLVDLSSRFSSKVNVIVESDDPQKAENTSKMFYAQIDKNVIENQRLVALRDSLLPKLMSGELDVSNIEI